MLNTRAAIVAIFSAIVLSGCSETTSQPTSSVTAMRTGSATDERACLNAVARETGNTTTVLSSEFSEANTLVMVGVGADRAPWRCLVNDGIVAEVSFAGDEGAL